MASNFGEKVERKLGSLLDRIPGYRGYQVKEDRRDADKRLRDHIATVYGAQADRVEQVAAALATQRRLTDISPVDEFARILRHFVDRVRTATYGYGGLFGDRDVNSAALDQLRQFDENLLASLDAITASVDALEAANSANGDLATPSRQGTRSVQALLAQFDLRGEVVTTGQPARGESVMRALEAPTGEIQSPAFELREGDALAILGDDHIVDGKIAIDGGDTAIRLFRLAGDEAERWLMVTRPEQAGMALVKPVAQPATAGDSTTIDAGSYRQTSSGTGDGEIAGSGGSSGLHPVRYRFFVASDEGEGRALHLDWGQEQQTFAGQRLFADDVEVFGRPEAEIN